MSFAPLDQLLASPVAAAVPEGIFLAAPHRAQFSLAQQYGSND
jgi:hypothetical protein